MPLGGGPVEIGSGIAGLAYSWVLGRRSEKELLNFRPHNVSMVGLGTFILWFGWLGFNGGSAFGANLRAVLAIWNSMLAAAFGGIVWCALDYRIERKVSMVGFCSGTIAGLVCSSQSVLSTCRMTLCCVGCCNPCIWLYSNMGCDRDGHCRRGTVQLWHKTYVSRSPYFLKFDTDIHGYPHLVKFFLRIDDALGKI